MSIQTYTGLLGVSAWCDDCGWESEARNALGNAMRHARAHQHTVHVEQTTGITYTPAGSAWIASKEAARAGDDPSTIGGSP